jgi:hypothetical protein
MMLLSLPVEMHHAVLPWLWLYIGPDAFLPLTSALAAVTGAVLIFRKKVSGAARRLWQLITRRPD